MDYASLQTNIAAFLNRSDLTAIIPTFIELAEARMRRMIRTRHTARLQANLLAAEDEMTLPTGIVEVKSVSISSPLDYAGPLTIVSYDEVLRQRGLLQTASAPKFIARVGDELFPAPLPDQTYVIDLEVEGPFTALSGTNTSNWVLADYPDVYLYGALAESAPYLVEDERVALWDSRFIAAMTELERAQKRSLWPGKLVQPLPDTFADC